MNDKRLIEFIKDHPGLYNPRLDIYADKYYREKCWLKLSQELKTSPLVLKSRWRTIRSNYRKALKRIEVNKNATAYKYHNFLSFVKPFLNSDRVMPIKNKLYDDDPLLVKVENIPGINLNSTSRRIDSECSSSDYDDNNMASGTDYDGDNDDDDCNIDNGNNYKYNCYNSSDNDKTGIVNSDVDVKPVKPVFPKIAKVRLDSETISKLPSTEKLPDIDSNHVHNPFAAKVNTVETTPKMVNSLPEGSTSHSPANQTIPIITEVSTVNSSNNFNSSVNHSTSSRSLLKTSSVNAQVANEINNKRQGNIDPTEFLNLTRRSRVSIDDKMNESSINQINKCCSNVSINNINNENTPKPDHIDTFLAGIGSTMKTFNPYQQNIAKTKIFSIVQELELERILNRDQRYLILSYNS